MNSGIAQVRPHKAKVFDETVESKDTNKMTQIQSTTNQATAPIAPIDPTSIIQSDSPTAAILAIAILFSMLVSGTSGLIRVIVVTRSFR